MVDIFWATLFVVVIAACGLGVLLAVLAEILSATTRRR